MMVSPSGSPERARGHPAPQAGFRRGSNNHNGGGQVRRFRVRWKRRRGLGEEGGGCMLVSPSSHKHTPALLASSVMAPSPL